EGMKLFYFLPSLLNPLKYSYLKGSIGVLGSIFLISSQGFLNPTLAVDSLPNDGGDDTILSIPSSIPADVLKHVGTELESVSQADFAVNFMNILGFPTSPMSDTASFVDIPVSHPAYPYIEALRERKLLWKTPQGIFNPDKAITKAHAYTTISGMLQGVPMTLSEAESIISRDEDRKTIPPSLVIGLGRMLQENFLKTSFRQTNLIGLDQNLTRGEMMILLKTLSDKVNGKSFTASRSNEANLPTLPPNILLKVSPTDVLYRESLSVGSTFYFTLVEPVILPTNTFKSLNDLPRNTRFRGRITASTNKNHWTLRLNQVQTPNNQFLRVKALIDISFQTEDPSAFVIPGTVFTTTTEAFNLVK
ncbi:MAG: S-layer homology domain-containing protein, partial [Cyanobacteria bacterium]|nr:S-layer homology domain-containing protein [Cyanobacteriota bacterium]